MLRVLLQVQLVFDSLCNLVRSFRHFCPFEHCCLWFSFLVTLRFALWFLSFLVPPSIFLFLSSIFPLLLHVLFSNFAISKALPYTFSLAPKIISWSSPVNAFLSICLTLAEVWAKVVSDCSISLPPLLISFTILLFRVTSLSSFAIIFTPSTFSIWLWFLRASSLIAIFSSSWSFLFLGITFLSWTWFLVWAIEWYLRCFCG